MTSTQELIDQWRAFDAAMKRHAGVSTAILQKVERRMAEIEEELSDRADKQDVVAATFHDMLAEGTL